MKPERYKKYLQEQVAEIEKYKWIESEKAGRNLGQKTVDDWVKKFAKVFRRKFVEEDLREALEKLTKLKKLVDQKGPNAEVLKEIAECEDRLKEGIELFENNHNNSK